MSNVSSSLALLPSMAAAQTSAQSPASLTTSSPNLLAAPSCLTAAPVSSSSPAMSPTLLLPTRPTTGDGVASTDHLPPLPSPGMANKGQETSVAAGSDDTHRRHHHDSLGNQHHHHHHHQDSFNHQHNHKQLHLGPSASSNSVFASSDMSTGKTFPHEFASRPTTASALLGRSQSVLVSSSGSLPSPTTPTGRRIPPAQVEGARSCLLW